jgi:hypothetical protein
VTASELGAEVEQAIARVDLTAAKRKAIRVRVVDPRFARDGGTKPGLRDKPAFAHPEQTGRVREGGDSPSKSVFQLGLRAPDL